MRKGRRDRPTVGPQGGSGCCILDTKLTLEVGFLWVTSVQIGRRTPFRMVCRWMGPTRLAQHADLSRAFQTRMGPDPSKACGILLGLFGAKPELREAKAGSSAVERIPHSILDLRTRSPRVSD